MLRPCAGAAGALTDTTTSGDDRRATPDGGAAQPIQVMVQPFGPNPASASPGPPADAARPSAPAVAGNDREAMPSAAGVTVRPFPNSCKIYVTGSRADLRVPMREIALSATLTDAGETPNPPVVVYDTSGPYTDPDATIDIGRGLPAVRAPWIEARGDTEVLDGQSSQYARDRAQDGKAAAVQFPNRPLPRRAKPGARVTQMHYAKLGEITPEMEYIAIRESQQLEQQRAAEITPEFVRDEVARARDHPGQHQPPGARADDHRPQLPGEDQRQHRQLGRHLVDRGGGREDGLVDALGRRHGDGPVDRRNIHETREWILRNSPVPIGTVPIYQALEKVDGNPEELTWELFRDTLIEQASRASTTSPSTPACCCATCR
jgi:phosphomethylpyrimidine synthase